MKNASTKIATSSAEAEHRHAALAQPPPGVLPERDADFGRFAVADTSDIYSSSTRGSRNAYDRSTSMFIMNRITV